MPRPLAASLVFLCLASYAGAQVTFAPAVRYALPSLVAPASTLLVAGDFNRDGRLDLLAVGADGGGAFPHDGAVAFLPGRGDGTFGPPIYSPAPINGDWIFAAGDFNGDGIPDLAISMTSASGDSGISVLLGRGDGSFQALPPVPVSPRLEGMAAGDFNGDGKTDLALSTGISGKVAVLLSQGDGTFDTPRLYAAIDWPRALVSADFNGDGKADIATGELINGQVGVLLGNGDGTFRPPLLIYPAGPFQLSIQAADFDDDGLTDLAVDEADGDGGVRVFLNRGQGSMGDSIYSHVGAYTGIMAVDDFDGDGLPDLLTTSHDDGLWFSRNAGGGRFDAPIRLASGFGTVAVGDFDGDGRPDIAVARNGGIDMLLDRTMPGSAGPSPVAPPVVPPQVQVVSTTPDTPVAVTLFAEDPAGKPLVYEVVSPPANGTLSGNPPDMTYTPAPGFQGEDRFTYRASNGAVTSGEAEIDVVVGTPPPSTGTPDPGKIDIQDVVTALRCVVGLVIPTPEQVYRYDVNDSGRIDIGDATILLAAAVGMGTPI